MSGFGWFSDFWGVQESSSAMGGLDASGARQPVWIYMLYGGTPVMSRAYLS